MHQWSLLSKPLVPIHQVSLFSMALEALIVDDFIPFPIKFSPITLAAPPSHLPDDSGTCCHCQIFKSSIVRWLLALSCLFLTLDCKEWPSLILWPGLPAGATALVFYQVGPVSSQFIGLCCTLIVMSPNISSVEILVPDVMVLGHRVFGRWYLMKESAQTSQLLLLCEDSQEVCNPEEDPLLTTLDSSLQCWEEYISVVNELSSLCYFITIAWAKTVSIWCHFRCSPHSWSHWVSKSQCGGMCLIFFFI